MSDEQQCSIFSVLAAILWLGNVGFVPLSEDAVAIAAGSSEAVSRAAALLRCPEEALLHALTKRKVCVFGGAPMLWREGVHCWCERGAESGTTINRARRESGKSLDQCIHKTGPRPRLRRWWRGASVSRAT